MGGNSRTLPGGHRYHLQGPSHSNPGPCPIPSLKDLALDHSPKSSPTSPSSFPVDSCTQPFIDFLNDHPTIFHAVDYFANRLEKEGFTRLSERDAWTDLQAGSKYFMTRNGGSMVAFVIGEDYKPGNGAAIIGAHVDVLAARLKPVSKLPTKAGYQQLAVSPYAGALNHAWLDRNLSIGGKVLIQDPETGKVTTKVMKLDWPIATIPTLAPHFGDPSHLPYNLETQMVPIIGLDGPSTWSSPESTAALTSPPVTGASGNFISMQPPKLVKAIAAELGLHDPSVIINWELELFNMDKAILGGLEKEFLFAPRIDDRACSWPAVEALILSRNDLQVRKALGTTESDGLINMVLLVDAEEIGSLSATGARSNLVSLALERITETMSAKSLVKAGAKNIMGQTLANSFFLSADVDHAVHPNFLNVHLQNHSASLNVGLTIATDTQGHFASTPVSIALLASIANKCGSTLQFTTPRNDARSGGTIGPISVTSLGMRGIDAGVPQLAMHSARAVTGARDVGLAAKMFKGFFDFYEEVDGEFRAVD